MRRLRNSRSPDFDELAAEGFDRADQEGDAIGPVADEIPWLRPFGSDLPGPVLAPGGGSGEPSGARAVREARELIRLGRRLDALLLLRRSLAEDPGADPGARLLLAELLESQGELEAALAELTLALRAGSDRFLLLVHRGSLLARTGKPAEAESDLREAIRQRPQDPAGHAELGIALLRRGRAADAARAFQEALRLAPDDPELLFQLGEALQGKGDLEDALETLGRAAARAPGDPRPLKLMGRLLDRMGRTEEAMAMHRRAREASLT
jgi:Flp pilus assembly protein TadD